MVKQTIQIFSRVKPTKGKTGQYELYEDSDGSPLISFNVPKELAGGVVNNKKELYKFKFERVFDQNTKQDEIFNHVAKPVMDNVLQGYNGTIFAYGQTGSGKTFTITGGAERYTDRGIIPRILSYIFDYYEKNSESVFSTYVSYLEIYNENGYDLLDPKHEAAKLEDLPKVSLMEDSDQNIHLKNLSTHQANNEEEALNLLFLGDTNRMIAETPMNQASTRSHCIFTIHITSREPGSATVRRSKLHLVDLAGSERVGKTGVNGILLTEAKYINLSLHYLEQVIVALGEKSRQHIPYRNSMMTSVLRDSLGGNCMTTMIATISVDRRNLDESISTCRFAQRVALIKNDAILNEELDPKLMIIRLKKELQQLKEELSMATGEQRTDALTEEDLERCREAVKQYLNESDPEATLDIGADMRKIHECFRIMKKKTQSSGSRTGTSTPSTGREATERSPPPVQTHADPGEAKKLQVLMRQRDNEINILVNMLKKEKKRAADALAELERLGRPLPDSAAMTADYANPSSGTSESASYSSMTNGHSSRDLVRGGSAGSERPPSVGKRNYEKRRIQNEREEKTKQQILGEMSMGRQEAFEIFRRDYEHNSTIDQNKTSLKQRYAEAKSLGEVVNKSRVKINKLKSSIEQHRMSRVMQGLVDPQNPEPDDMEQDMRAQIEEEKARYKEAFNRLRSLKTEIEHLQHLLEKSKVKLMKDFEIWWAEQAASAQEQQEKLRNLPPGKAKSAWRTPPVTPSVAALQSHNSQTSLASDSSSVLSRGSASASGSQPAARHPGHQRVPPILPSSDTSVYSSKESTHSHRGSDRGQTRPADPPGGSSIQMTGDAEADADIMAFLRAREKIQMLSAQQGGR